MAVDPISFLGVALVTEPLTLAVPESHIEMAPVDAFVADVATPSMINIVLELAFEDEVVALSAQALHAAVLVHLSEGGLGVVLTDSQIVVHGAVRRCVTHDVLGEQDAQLVPLL